MSTFLEGLALGLVYTMPIGVQNLFVIQQAISMSRPNAYFTAFMVSLADLSLGFACFFGVGRTLSSVPSLRWILLFGGAGFLLWTAYGLLTSKERNIGEPTGLISKRKIAQAAFTLTWANPHAITDGSILLGSFSMKLALNDIPAFLFGLSIASPVWFFGLTTVASFAALYITPSRFVWMNRACGVMLVLLAANLLKAVFV